MGVSSLLIVGFKSVENVQPLVIDCPKCQGEYDTCTGDAGKAYTSAVEKAADSIKSRSARLNYSAACAEARRIKNKAIAECTETYNKCCLAEAKAEKAKAEKEKENQ